MCATGPALTLAHREANGIHRVGCRWIRLLRRTAQAQSREEDLAQAEFVCSGFQTAPSNDFADSWLRALEGLNFVVQTAVERVENTFGVGHAAFLCRGAIGRCHSTTNPGPCRVNPVMATKRVEWGSTPDFGDGAGGNESSSSVQKRFSGS